MFYRIISLHNFTFYCKNGLININKTIRKKVMNKFNDEIKDEVLDAEFTNEIRYIEDLKENYPLR